MCSSARLRRPGSRRVRLRAVLGRRGGARPAAAPAHGDAAAGRIRGAGYKTLRDASSRATKAFYPALSMCDLIFSGVFERHPRLTLAIVEFELAWAPHLLSTMDYTYRERHGEAIYRLEARSGLFGNPTRGTARRRRSARVHPAAADRREQRWPSARARSHEG